MTSMIIFFVLLLKANEYAQEKVKNDSDDQYDSHHMSLVRMQRPKCIFQDIDFGNRSGSTANNTNDKENLFVINSIKERIKKLLYSTIASFIDPIVIEDIYDSHIGDDKSCSENVTGITISGHKDTVVKSITTQILPPSLTFELNFPELVFDVDSCLIYINFYKILCDINMSGQIIITNTKLTCTIGLKILPPGVASVTTNLEFGIIKSTMMGFFAQIDIKPVLTFIIEKYFILILGNLSGSINAVISVYIWGILKKL